MLLWSNFFLLVLRLPLVVDAEFKKKSKKRYLFLRTRHHRFRSERQLSRCSIRSWTRISSKTGVAGAVIANANISCAAPSFLPINVNEWC